MSFNIVPIPDKFDIVHYANAGIAVEVGVFEGEFTKHNLKTWLGDYYLVDSWGHRKDGTIDKNDENEGHWANVMSKCIENTSWAGPRVKFKKGLSVEVASQFPDEFFDWIFIDAGHDFVNCLNDLNAWWPKLRSGGLFSGDDFGLHEGHLHYNLTPERYKQKYGGTAEVYKWGTAQALDSFCTQNNLKYSLTWMNDKHNEPCWYLTK